MFVIFGATGDLSRRKLLPALAHAYQRGELDSNHHVVGLSSDTTLTESKFRDLAREALKVAKVPAEQLSRFCDKRLHFQTIGKGTPEDFRALASRLYALSEALGLPQNFAFYLALPPNIVLRTVAGLDGAGLSSSNGWVRLVIEKPFGHDLESARELNATLHKHFKEKQIYRIDHYLGKETVQNLLVFRFANPIFEALWNRERIQAVEITVAESLGVEKRAGYYDTSGALRDMVQNHLTQLLTLVGMEVPSAFAADAIRYEKIKVLRSVAPIDPAQVIRGQYTAGEVDRGQGEGLPRRTGRPCGLDHRNLRCDAAQHRFLALAGSPVLLAQRQTPEVAHDSDQSAFPRCANQLFQDCGGAAGYRRRALDHLATGRRLQPALRRQGAG